MRNQPTRPLAYRPALDGLRGVAVLAVVTFHLFTGHLDGGWLGVDLFFVLSGFLITTILVREYGARGGVDLKKFWFGRARRLLPALVVVLLFVVAAAAAWTLPSRRGAAASDVFASLFYYANWHFLFSDEAYFAQTVSPSPLRHTWSLAIEEQYYIVFPLLLLVLARFIHRRRNLALVFAGFAVISAVWMAVNYTPGVDPTRVYYGTDTRAFELLIGACAGAWVGPAQWGRRSPSRWVRYAEILAWPSLVAMVALFVLADENASWLFRGGLFAFCCAAVITILAAASPHENAFQRVLAFEPLRLLGIISYGVYLWHWPIHIYLTSERLHLSESATPWAQALIALAASIASYKLIEMPIRTRHLSGLIPRRPLIGQGIAAFAVLAVVFSAALLPRSDQGASAQERGAVGGDLKYTVPSYTPKKDKTSLTLVGNSIPNSLYVNFPQSRFPDIDLNQSVSFGCVPFNATELTDGKPTPTLPECTDYVNRWDAGIKRNDVALYFIPQNLLYDYRVDGHVAKFGTPEHDQFIESTFDAVAKKMHERGVSRIAYANLSCHDMPTFGVKNGAAAIMNNTEHVEHLNSVLKKWAPAHDVTVVDQFSFLCPGGQYHGTINGTDLYEDALHFTPTSGPIFWSWLAPQLQR